MNEIEYVFLKRFLWKLFSKICTNYGYLKKNEYVPKKIVNAINLL